MTLKDTYSFWSSIPHSPTEKVAICRGVSVLTTHMAVTTVWMWMWARYLSS
jgi:hypothetical protein